MTVMNGHVAPPLGAVLFDRTRVLLTQGRRYEPFIDSAKRRWSPTLFFIASKYSQHRCAGERGVEDAALVIVLRRGAGVAAAVASRQVLRMAARYRAR